MEYGRDTGRKRLLYSKLSDRIYQYIKEEHLSPGDRLPGERKLAADWKVSRPSLREAIRELENQGIVRVEVGKGTFVTDYVEGRQLSINLALKNFLELFEIKTVLERYSLEKAIPNISEEKLKELEDMAVQMDAVAAKGIMPKEMDHQFHRSISESYGNQELANLVCNMIEMYETFDNDLYGYFEDKDFDYLPILLQTFPYHLEMVRMMKERNVEEALKRFDKIVALDLEIYGQIK
ncbi:FadR family transcriptional regulator [Clostridium sp. AF19-22AC]|jgi:GntR family transcriptional repressor for pyruvate dehydrogenase complex|uniref:DNA-binding FadR family transcriptional regulator n=1 Tax=Faecalicatena orotica TaxID=1544 RepID=A0A2Y9C6M5_9FIRM|nr:MULTISPECIES: GntR family transcriptional regulator [Clostridia]PWJ21447.1 DNA-binding FadR family transcriptional regulator [Faecalicatena orotica]RHR28077.1 FadR family transcriptional regulator [Clostridium sp. AF19-22AC]SSA58422.1 DNA-binding transcriptional regulator, FadR family [Faecalicatena orotica]